MKTDGSERDFLDRIKGALDESAARLDLKSQARLLGIRRKAVEAVAPPGERRFQIPRWLTTGAFVTGVVAVTMALVLIPAPQKKSRLDKVEDLEIVSSKEGVDFYADMDFYRWLASERQ